MSRTPAQPKREREDRLADQFLMLQLIAQAGVISARLLNHLMRYLPEVRMRHGLDARDRLASDAPRLKVLSTSLVRDRESLESAGLIRIVDHEGQLWCMPGEHWRGLWAGGMVVPATAFRSLPANLRALVRPEWVERADYLQDMPIPRQPERIPPEVRHAATLSTGKSPFSPAMGESLAAMQDATRFVTGAEDLVADLIAQYRERCGDPPADRVRVRQLVPSFERSRERISHRHLEILKDAIRRGKLVDVRWGDRKKALKAGPRRLVYYHGRPRLEVTVGFGRPVLKYIPLHRIEEVRARAEDLAAGYDLTAEDAAWLERTWGLDAGTDLGQQRGMPLAARAERVVLDFSGDAYGAVQEDPGYPGLLPIALRVNARKVLRYEVETIVGPAFLRWLRMWGPEVEVLEPRWLRVRWSEEAAEIARRHAT